MGTQLSSGLGKVKALEKRSSAPILVTLSLVQVGSLTATSSTVIMDYGNNLYFYLLTRVGMLSGFNSTNYGIRNRSLVDIYCFLYKYL